MNASEVSNNIPRDTKFVLAGGGTLVDTARPLLKLGVDMSGAEKPHVLTIPTPKLDNREAFDKSVASVQKVFGDQFGASVESLHDFDTIGSTDELQDKFDRADTIYISGGNTRRAMETWKRHGVIPLMNKAMDDGKVFTGISAGALAWFNKAHSDSESYEVPKGQPWDYTTVNGIDRIHALATAHFNSTDTPDGRLRSEHFGDLLRKLSAESGHTETGLGIDNESALVSIDGLVSVMRARDGAGLHVMAARPNGQTTTRPLEAPSGLVTPDKISADMIPDGISWDSFYSQLGKS